MAIGIGILVPNISAGNVPGAILDAGGLALDLGATAVPFVPGGASASIKASRLAANARFGKAFENAVLNAVEFSKNTSRLDAASGAKNFRVPDGLESGILLEVKGVKRLSLNSQVNDFIAEAGERGDTAVTNATRISKEFQELGKRGEVVVVRLTPE